MKEGALGEAEYELLQSKRGRTEHMSVTRQEREEGMEEGGLGCRI